MLAIRRQSTGLGGSRREAAEALGQSERDQVARHPRGGAAKKRVDFERRRQAAPEPGVCTILHDHAAQPSGAAEMGKPLRLLMVEDCADDAALIGLELERAGYDVLCRRVDTAETMKRALDNGVWDAVIADYSMPTFSAPRALELLRRRSLDIPFIIVSGTIGEDIAVEAMRAGASDYFIKGNLQRLGAAVEREIAEAASRSARRRAERALKRSETYNRALLRAIPDLILRMDREGTTLDAISEDALGSDAWPCEIVGRSVREVLPEPVAGRFMGAIEAVFADGGAPSVECELEREATRRTFECRFTICGQHEVLVIARDVTKQRSMEQQMRAAQRMDAVGRVAGGVAHDFNNLLTVIGGHAELLQEALDGDHPHRKDVEVVLDTVDRAAQLVNQLLAFSRRQIQQLEIVDLNRIVGGVDTMLQRVIREDIDLRTCLDPQVGRIDADPSQIEQVVMNLVVNARDAMPEGGTLTITTARVRIEEDHVRANGVAIPPGDYAMLSVTDTGVGMDKETQAQIFEPFFTTKEAGKGTGLGLSTLYGIIAQSRGHVRVASDPGKGTRFEIYLPRVESKEKPRARPAPPSSLAGSETVLLVEDEEVVREIVARVLKSRGYRVLSAGSGDQALRLWQRHSEEIDLLVTDVVMPGTSGPELARQLQALRPEIGVLLMSGYAQDLRPDRLPERAGFLHKPFTSKPLLLKVREVLDRTSSAHGADDSR